VLVDLRTIIIYFINVAIWIHRATKTLKEITKACCPYVCVCPRYFLWCGE